MSGRLGVRVAAARRAVIVHEAPRTFGPGAEIATSLVEGAFLYLEAPIRRVTAYDMPFVGVAREKANIPDAPRLVTVARETVAYWSRRRWLAGVAMVAEVWLVGDFLFLCRQPVLILV